MIVVDRMRQVRNTLLREWATARRVALPNAFALAALVAACAAPARSPVDARAEAPAPTLAPVATAPAAVDLTGTWATGRGGEPEAKQLVLHPQCNYSPAVWILQQNGDTVRAWTVPESWAQGVASTEVANAAPAVGRVSGVDVVIGTTDARYVLRFDSTSGHLRGTLNGAPFWAVPLDIVRPEDCIAVP